MWIYFVMHFLLHASRKNNSNNNLSALLLTTSLLIHDNGGLSLLSLIHISEPTRPY